MMTTLVIVPVIVIVAAESINLHSINLDQRAVWQISAPSATKRLNDHLLVMQ